MHEAQRCLYSDVKGGPGHSCRAAGEQPRLTDIRITDATSSEAVQPCPESVASVLNPRLAIDSPCAGPAPWSRHCTLMALMHPIAYVHLDWPAVMSILYASASCATLVINPAVGPTESVATLGRHCGACLSVGRATATSRIVLLPFRLANDKMHFTQGSSTILEVAIRKKRCRL